MKCHLQVKVATLAAEMSYIHRKEIKWKERARHARLKADRDKTLYAEEAFWSMRYHRKDLKSEARWSHLAYGFMRGRSYPEMEFISYGGIKGYNREVPNWERIEEIVVKFSKDEPDPGGIMQKFGEWLAAAKVWFDANPQRIEDAKKERGALAARRRNDPAHQAALKTTREEAEKFGRMEHAAGWRKVNGRWRQEAA
jgi:hypothetical protein